MTGNQPGSVLQAACPFLRRDRLWRVVLCLLCMMMSPLFAAGQHGLEGLPQTGSRKPDSSPAPQVLVSPSGKGRDLRSDAAAFSRALREAGTKARAGDWQGAAEIFESFPGDSYYKRKLFSELAEVWLLLELPEQLSVRPEFASPATGLPSVPAGYPQDLCEAAARYLAVAAPFQMLTGGRNPDQERIDYQTHRTDYWKLVASLIANKDGPFTDKLLAYRWGGWCGTGSDQFQEPQSLALLMALASDKRWAEAAGAALSATPGGGSGGALRVLSVSVPDPEKIVVGGLALTDLGPEEYRTGSRRASLLALLLCLPGDRRVETLTRLASLAPPDALPIYFRALAKFVRRELPPPANNESIHRGWGWADSSDNLDTITAESAGEGAQKLALDFLSSQASSTLPVRAAETLARTFQEKRRPEFLPALHRLLAHPSMTVAKEAAEALEILGEKVMIPPKLGPVRYSILVNGIPCANTKVSWTVIRGSTSTGSEATSDAAGLIELPRDMFLDQSAAAVRSVALRTSSMAGPADPWFGVLLPAPPASDEVVPVEVKTSSLRVVLPLPRPMKELTTMEVVLWGLQDEKTQEAGFWAPAKFQLPVSESLDFKILAPGVYRAEIRMAGATSWSGELHADTTPSITVPLQRASEVGFTLALPPAWHINALLPELWRDGKRFPSDWDYNKHLFHGVPEGNYVLHIPSSAEVRKRVRSLVPDGPEFSGVDVPFEIGPHSPAEINLGEIGIKAVNAGDSLQRGDFLMITFSNKNDQIDGCYAVLPEGFVNMPFIGKIKAEGLSASGLKTTLEREYDLQEIYKGIRISVERMDKPPDTKPFLSDLRMLEQIEANPFWNKKGDFFTPGDRSRNPPTP